MFYERDVIFFADLFHRNAELVANLFIAYMNRSSEIYQLDCQWSKWVKREKVDTNKK